MFPCQSPYPPHHHPIFSILLPFSLFPHHRITPTQSSSTALHFTPPHYIASHFLSFFFSSSLFSFPLAIASPPRTNLYASNTNGSDLYLHSRGIAARNGAFFISSNLPDLHFYPSEAPSQSLSSTLFLISLPELPFLRLFPFPSPVKAWSFGGIVHPVAAISSPCHFLQSFSRFTNSFKR